MMQQVQLSEFTCSCGVVYWLTKKYETELRRTHKTWYCPNGCPRWFPGKTDEQRLREVKNELAKTKEVCEVWRDQAESREHQINGYKGALAVARKRSTKA